MLKIYWFPLSHLEITNRVSRKPGSYVLSKRLTAFGDWLPDYVGRDDVDVARRLGEHVGDYSVFGWVNVDSRFEAYALECSWFHELTPPDNILHPARPAFMDCSCPVIGCLFLGT